MRVCMLVYIDVPCCIRIAWINTCVNLPSLAAVSTRRRKRCSYTFVCVYPAVEVSGSHTWVEDWHTRVHVPTPMSTCICEHKAVCRHTTLQHMYIYVHAYTYAYSCTCLCTYACIYMDIWTYAHMHVGMALAQSLQATLPPLMTVPPLWC